MNDSPIPMRRATSRRIVAASDKLSRAVNESCAELARFMLVHCAAKGNKPAHAVPHPAIAEFVRQAEGFHQIVQAVLHPPASEPTTEEGPA